MGRSRFPRIRSAAVQGGMQRRRLLLAFYEGAGLPSISKYLRCVVNDAAPGQTRRRVTVSITCTYPAPRVRYVYPIAYAPAGRASIHTGRLRWARPERTGRFSTNSSQSRSIARVNSAAFV